MDQPDEGLMDAAGRALASFAGRSSRGEPVAGPKISGDAELPLQGRGRSRSLESSERRRRRRRGGSRDNGRKSRSSRGKDRGPFGAGEALDVSRDEVTGDESSSDRQDFRVASSSGISQHLKLMNYARRLPGRLSRRLRRRMADLLALEGGADSTQGIANLYYLTLLAPAYRSAICYRSLRECRTLCLVLDLLAKHKVEEATDLVSQRLKAVELSMADQGWDRAVHLELVPAEAAGLIDKSEAWAASRERELDQRNLLGVTATTPAASAGGMGQASASGSFPPAPPFSSQGAPPNNYGNYRGRKGKGKGKGKQ